MNTPRHRRFFDRHQIVFLIGRLKIHFEILNFDSRRLELSRSRKVSATRAFPMRVSGEKTLDSVRAYISRLSRDPPVELVSIFRGIVRTVKSRAIEIGLRFVEIHLVNELILIGHRGPETVVLRERVGQIWKRTTRPLHVWTRGVFLLSRVRSRASANFNIAFMQNSVRLAFRVPRSVFISPLSLSRPFREVSLFSDKKISFSLFSRTRYETFSRSTVDNTRMMLLLIILIFIIVIIIIIIIIIIIKRNNNINVIH